MNTGAQQRVLEAIRAGAGSRDEIARETGLHRWAIENAVRRLRDANLLERSDQRGRRTKPAYRLAHSSLLSQVW